MTRAGAPTVRKQSLVRQSNFSVTQFHSSASANLFTMKTAAARDKPRAPKIHSSVIQPLLPCKFMPPCHITVIQHATNMLCCAAGPSSYFRGRRLASFDAAMAAEMVAAVHHVAPPQLNHPFNGNLKHKTTYGPGYFWDPRRWGWQITCTAN